MDEPCCPSLHNRPAACSCPFGSVHYTLLPRDLVLHSSFLDASVLGAKARDGYSVSRHREWAGLRLRGKTFIVVWLPLTLRPFLELPASQGPKATTITVLRGR